MFKRSLQKPLGKYLGQKNDVANQANYKMSLTRVPAPAPSNSLNLYSKSRLIKEMQFANSHEKMIQDLDSGLKKLKSSEKSRFQASYPTIVVAESKAQKWSAGKASVYSIHPRQYQPNNPGQKDRLSLPAS